MIDKDKITICKICKKTKYKCKCKIPKHIEVSKYINKDIDNGTMQTRSS